MTFLPKSDTFRNAYGVVEKIATGQALPEDGAIFTDKLLN